MSDFLWPHKLQHSRPPCPSLSPGVCSYSCLLSLWHYLTISSSAASFSFSLNLSQHHGLFQWVNSTSSGQSIGALASISVPPMNIQCWFPLGLIGLISLQSEGLLGVFSSTIQKHCKFTNYFVCLSYFKLSILLKYLIMIVDFLILFMPLWSFLVHVFWDCLFKSQ